ncbi:hypothetical protein C6341_g3848 [Phytophthora cactorum]|nr:hypothetical protein C6341_g3848 [Phytophthora cactorum]
MLAEVKIILIIHRLYGAFVGAVRSEFEIEIDDAKSVFALKKAIKKINLNKFKGVDANDLELFLANEKLRAVGLPSSRLREASEEDKNCWESPVPVLVELRRVSMLRLVKKLSPFDLLALK